MFLCNGKGEVEAVILSHTYAKMLGEQVLICFQTISQTTTPMYVTSFSSISYWSNSLKTSFLVGTAIPQI